ncbi:MAG: cytochrome P450 [Burkholderiaceae bacterium]
MLDIKDLPGPRGLPLIGMLHRWRPSRAHLLFEQWAHRHGPIYRVQLGPQPIVVVSESSAILQLLKARPEGFRRHFAVRPIFREMGIDGLFSAEAEDWRRQRPLVMRALDPEHLRRFFPVLVTATRRLHARWLDAAQAHRTIDVRSDLTRYTVDVTCSLAFGTDVATLTRDDPDPLQRHLDRIFQGMARRINALWPSWRYLKLPEDRRIEQSLRAAGKEVERFIAAARQAMTADPRRFDAPENLLQALLAANEQARLSDAELHGNVMTLLLAGEDTTSNTIAWALHLLARHPEHAAQARQEALSMLAREGSPQDRVLTTFEPTRELPFIEAIVLEALRLKPVAPLNMFTALQETELLGTRIVPRTLVCILKRPPATDPDLWPQAERFDPSRWTDAAASQAVSGGARRAFMPFGGGPRFCPGRYLALLEAKMVLATVLASFELDPVQHEVPEQMGMTMQPADLRMKLRALV